jgi:hypothetical protein
MVRLAHHEREEFRCNSISYSLVLSLSKDIQQVFTQSVVEEELCPRNYASARLAIMFYT